MRLPFPFSFLGTALFFGILLLPACDVSSKGTALKSGDRPSYRFSFTDPKTKSLQTGQLSFEVKPATGDDLQWYQYTFEGEWILDGNPMGVFTQKKGEVFGGRYTKSSNGQDYTLSFMQAFTPAGAWMLQVQGKLNANEDLSSGEATYVNLVLSSTTPPFGRITLRRL